jgi:hypothetical protein
MSCNTTYYYNILRITTYIKITQNTSNYYVLLRNKDLTKYMGGGGMRTPPLYFVRSVLRSILKYFVVIEQIVRAQQGGSV